MATELEQRPATKYEKFVEQQLDKAKGRIRALDAGGWALMFVILTLGYFLFMAVLDCLVTNVSGGTYGLTWMFRLSMFVIYAVGALSALEQLVMCFVRRVNPYYAARQLEQTMPQAKNSVINWLDLREEKLAPAIRGAVGLKAAKVLKQADPEKAVGARFTMILGAVTLGLVLGLLVLFLMERNRFGELLSRIFAPFGGSGLRARTEIDVVHPKDLVVRLNSPVPFKVGISGAPAANTPGAPRIQYRYNPNENYDDKVYLALEEQDGFWVKTMPVEVVKNGFWYRVSAGDALSPEYKVEVQSFPVVTHYEITYNYRPYLKKSKEMLDFGGNNPPVIRAQRGTEITLVARTNRKLKAGKLELDFGDKRQETKVGELVGNDALSFKFVPLSDGKFRVLFTSSEDEANSNSSYYPIDIMKDNAPVVVLEKPGKDIDLPANGTLTLAGHAMDDFGIKAMTLRMKVDGKLVAPKPYLPQPSFMFDNGTYPSKLNYLDVVALEKIKTEQGAAVPLAKGMKLEYWLEAADNYDFPSEKNANVGRSQSFKVNILDAEQDKKKQEQDRQKAEQQKNKHDQQQNKNLQDRNDARNKNDTEGEKQIDRDIEKQKLDKQKQELEAAAAEAKRMQDQAGGAKGNEPKRAEAKPGDGKSDPNQAKADNKSESKGGPPKNQKDPEPKAGPKEKANADSKPGDNNPDAGKPPAQVKQDQKTEQKSQAKQNGKNSEPDAKVKAGPEENKQDNLAQPKEDKNGKAENVAKSKGAGAPPPPQDNTPKNPSELAKEKIAQNANDLNDPNKRPAAEKELKDLAKSKDPIVQKEAQNALDKDKGMQDVAQNANDLKGNDPKKKEEAKENLQNTAQNHKNADVRNEAKKELDKNQKRENIAQKGQQLKDPKTSAAAEKSLQKTANDPKADPEQRQDAKNELEKHQAQKDFAKAQEKLNSKDEKKRAQGRKDMEKMAQNPNVQEQAKQELQKDDAKNAPTAAERKAAEEKVAQQKAAQEKSAQQAREKKEGMDKLAKNFKDLNDPAKEKRDNAQKEIEKQAAGASDEDVRKTANDILNKQKTREDLAKKLEDLNNPDKDIREKARKDLEDQFKKAQNNLREEAERKKNLEDLAANGKDDKVREEAKKELERTKDLKDLTTKINDLDSQDPKTRELAQKFVEEMAKKAKDDNIRKDAQKVLDRAKAREELANLSKDLESQDPETRKKAEGTLKKMMDDPNQGKQAKDALDLQNEKDQLAKAIEDLKDNKTREEARKKLGEMSWKASDPTIRQAAVQGINDDNLRAKKPNLDFTKPGGEMNLDLIREKLKDPNVWKDLKWTEEQAKRFLKDAEAYNRDLAKRQKIDAARNVGKGNTSIIESAGPTVIKGKDSNPTITDFSQPLPPPEFIEAYRKLTGSGGTTPKK